MAERMTYDKSIGSEERSAVAATKTWGIVLAVVFLLGLIMIAVFLMSGTMRDSGGPATENTATRPAEP